MRHVRTWAIAGAVIAGFLLSPVLLILAAPVAIGVGLDLFDRFGAMPVMLALCGSIACVLLRRLLSGVPMAPAAAWIRARRRPARAPARDHAAKSIS
jgi:hypothetical protein